MSERPFTLVYRPQTELAALERFTEVRQVAPSGELARFARTIGERATPDKDVLRAGVWDLGAQAGYLYRLIERFNESQGDIRFFQVRAAVPVGIVRTAEAMVGWLKQHDRRVTKAERRDIAHNLVANDFHPHADRVRRKLGLHYIIGITPRKIAGLEDKPYWDYFATQIARTLLVSTFDLPRYAARAKRPYEAAVGSLVLGILLAAENPKVDYHAQTRGCLFDFNDDRNSIVNGLRNPSIDPECLTRIKKRYRDAATSLVNALRDYGPEPGRGSGVPARGGLR